MSSTRLLGRLRLRDSFPLLERALKENPELNDAHGIRFTEEVWDFQGNRIIQNVIYFDVDEKVLRKLAHGQLDVELRYDWTLNFHKGVMYLEWTLFKDNGITIKMAYRFPPEKPTTE